MRKYIWLLLFLALALTGCSAEKVKKVKPAVKPKINTTENLSIMTTNKFLYYMVKDIAKDNNDVDYMLKTENEQWNYEYSDDALSNIANKDLFIYFGAGFEPWLEDFLGDISNGKVTNINSSRGSKIIKLGVPVEYGDETLRDNPYYWMNPDNYKIIMSNIKNAIQEKDPQNRKIYEENFDENMKQLSQIEDEIDDYSSNFEDYTFVTYGDKFDYLAQGMGIKLVKIYEDSDETDIEDKLDDAREDKKGLVFLKNDEILPQICKNIINKYDMKKARVSSYADDMDYINLVKKDFEAIKAAIGSIEDESIN